MSYVESSQSVKAWLLAARPKTLTAAVVPIMVATFLAYSTQGTFEWWIVWDALLASLFIQVGTNLINDALDFKKGADTEKRIGPIRVTQMGWLTMQQVLAAGIACFFLAILFGIPLIIHGGPALLAVFIFSVVSGYIYTGGPYPLSYLGLGDLFVMLFFGWTATMSVYFLQTGTVSISSFVAGTEIGLLCTVLIAVNNLRDIEQDVLAGKKTLAVRFGKMMAKVEITFLTFFAFVLNLYWLYENYLYAAILPFLLLPFAVRFVKNIWNTDSSPVYNTYLIDSAKLHFLFGALLSLGFVFR